MSTTAYMGYSYKEDRWVLFGINLAEEALPDVSYISRRLTDKGNYLFPVMAEASVKTLSFDGKGKYSLVVADDFEFPEVVTLEQSIENNRKFLATYC
jgi:hypothetical protein